jgi:hypothetical protein
MTYNPNIPMPLVSPANSAAPIQVNFSQFAGIFSRLVGGVTYNHIPLNDFNQGKHAAIIMQNQLVDPPVNQNLAMLLALNATTAANTQPELFVKIPLFLPTALDTTLAQNTPMQLTYNQVNVVGPNQYQSFLPGGYLIYFGSTMNIAANIPVLPTPTAIVIALATPVGFPYNVSTLVVQPNQIQIRSSNAPALTTFLYLVIARN